MQKLQNNIRLLLFQFSLFYLHTSVVSERLGHPIYIYIYIYIEYVCVCARTWCPEICEIKIQQKVFKELSKMVIYKFLF